MAYRVNYTTNDMTKRRRRLSFRLPILTLLCLVLFFILVEHLWPEGSLVLYDITVWVDSLPPVSALQQVAADFRNGEEVLEAFSGFFRTMLP